MSPPSGLRCQPVEGQTGRFHVTREATNGGSPGDYYASVTIDGIVVSTEVHTGQAYNQAVLRHFINDDGATDVNDPDHYCLHLSADVEMKVITRQSWPEKLIDTFKKIGNDQAMIR